MNPVDVCSLAQDLAREGFAVFPCLDDETPACPLGIHYASTNLPRVAWLWRTWPGPLIGFAAGPRSGIWALCIDLRQPEANAWWQTNAARLPPTRIYQSRHGLSLYYRDGGGSGCSSGRICLGVDIKGQGDYAIHWPAAGLECFDYTPPARCPTWLREALTPSSSPPAAPPESRVP